MKVCLFNTDDENNDEGGKTADSEKSEVPRSGNTWWKSVSTTKGILFACYNVYVDMSSSELEKFLR